ncbi:SDR family oxidoreductase [Agrobacterium rosae]|uniref:SDR family oxidoreductase n=1 Tax=Agrobacterium rosae TaxID=1972867 RepID=UPI0019D34D6B|nr:SDR family oxidoreductase [Agrobacterium rosae]MBN7808361.1 SDR family oxidoreductase [Agrobacterium rosae]
MAAFNRQIDVNVKGVAAAVRAAVPLMTDGGRIVSIGTTGAVHVPFAGAADYVATKAAVAAYIVLIAVPWSKLPSALSGLPNWNGRIVIDANNPIEAPLFKPAELNGRLSTEIVAGLVPGARVVKAFNHLLAALLTKDPHAEGGERVLFYSGDDGNAKAKVADLIAQLGFAGVDLGPISIGGRLAQFPGGPLPANNFVKFA